MKFSTLHLILIFITFGLTSYSFAYTPYVKHLGVENGLSNNYIVDIVQDNQGCIWIATESGLNRFDGRSFTIYTTKNSALVSNELNTLLFDKQQNTLWIGTQRDGISMFDCTRQTFTHLTSNEGLATDDVTCLSHTSDGGGIWITHYHIGVEHYDKATGKLTVYGNRNIEGMKSQNWCALDDGQGRLYVGHARDGMSIIDINTRTARNITPDPGNPHGLPGNSVRDMHKDQFGNIWLATNQGLVLYNPQKDSFFTFRNDPRNPNSLGSNSIFSIEAMADGTLWIGTDMTGISILNLSDLTLRNPEQIEFHHITATGQHDSLSSVNVKSIFQDSFQNVWVGNYRMGIDCISKTQPLFRTLPYFVTPGESVGDKQIWSMCVDTENRTWIGGDSELVVFRNGEAEKSIDMTSHLPHLHRYINIMKCDSQATLWLGVYRGGLLKMNAKTYQPERVSTELLNRLTLRGFFEDDRGKMWICTDNGLYSYYKGHYAYEEKINNQLEDKVVFSFIRDQQGKIWIGTFGKGVHIFDEDENLILNLTKENGFCSNAINDLYMDSKGGMWVATRKGLAHIPRTDQPSEFKVYGDKQGIENPHVCALHEDAGSHIWVSTNAGISRLNPSRGTFENFNHHDGVPLGDFMNGVAYTDTTGNLFFASLNGVCYFNPQHLNAQTSIPKVEIISVRSFDKKTESQSERIEIPLDNKSIELHHGRNSFRITFAVTDYSYSEQTEYMYTLDGLERIWYNLQDENQITFRNVPPGRYTFKVKARVKSQEWSEDNLAILPIHIHPPLWLTWYAKLLYISLACGICYSLIHSYKNKLNLKTTLRLERENSRNKQELNEERLRFYTNITHELRTPLTLILGSLEDLASETTLPETFKKRIKMIYDSATQLLNLVNQILEFRKTETQNRQLMISKGDLGSLVTEIGLRYKELNQNSNVTFDIAIETEDTILYYDTDIITTILNNLLSNALKYTPEGEIRLTLRSIEMDGERFIEIEVSDTGFGIAPDALPHIFDRYYQVKGSHQASGTGIGLALVKSLTDIHEGTLKVYSTLGKGTGFIFRLRIANTYPYALHATDKRANSEVPVSTMDKPEMEEDNDALPIVLVVEDNTDIREYIVQSLSDSYQVITAANGKGGQQLARQRIPNIIVSDIMMPEMDGLEFCSLMKKDIRTSHIPIILLTAKDSMQDREEGYVSGADSYLTKPFSAKLLRSRMQNLLESRKHLASQTISFVHTDDSRRAGKELSTIKISPLDKDFLDKLTTIITENLDLPALDVVFLRGKMFMSGSTFYRKVKGLTNLSPNEFIRKIRLHRSVELLLSGEHNVSEVAYMTGFSDAGYFRQCFKDEYGMTPTEYRKQMGTG